MTNLGFLLNYEAFYDDAPEHLDMIILATVSATSSRNPVSVILLDTVCQYAAQSRYTIHEQGSPRRYPLAHLYAGLHKIASELKMPVAGRPCRALMVPER